MVKTETLAFLAVISFVAAFTLPVLAPQSELFSVGTAGVGPVQLEELPGGKFSFTYQFRPNPRYAKDCQPERGCGLGTFDVPTFENVTSPFTKALNSSPWVFQVVKSEMKTGGLLRDEDLLGDDGPARLRDVSIGSDDVRSLGGPEVDIGSLNDFFPKLDGRIIDVKEALMDVTVHTPKGLLVFKPGEVKEIDEFIKVQYNPILSSTFVNDAGESVWIKDFRLNFKFQFDMNGMQARYDGPEDIQFKGGQIEELEFILNNDIEPMTAGVFGITRPESGFLTSDEMTRFEPREVSLGDNSFDLPINIGILGRTEIQARPTVVFTQGTEEFLSLRGSQGVDALLDIQPKVLGTPDPVIVDVDADEVEDEGEAVGGHAPITLLLLLGAALLLAAIFN